MLAAFLGLLVVSPTDAVFVTVPTPEERILFVGNSLTFANDLPRKVRELSEHHTAAHVESAAVAFPNFSLEDHWNDGRARRRLLSGSWTLVVMQQGPSGGAEGRRVLRTYAKRFGELAKSRGARVALYQVWPARQRLADLDAVIESHVIAAREAGGSVIPVGAAWRLALRRNPGIPLYGRDGFHPSPAGTYLAALVFRRWITGAPSRGVTGTWRGGRQLSLSPDDGALLEEVSEAVVDLNPKP